MFRQARAAARAGDAVRRARHRRRRVARRRTPEPKPEPSAAGARRLDGAHRTRRAAARRRRRDAARRSSRCCERECARWPASWSSAARARSRPSASAALRESARQVAHELKNPLTPIRFAVERLRRDAPPELAETVEVLAIESQRLEAMARSFAQFGRLPEGPRAEVDVGELVRYTARATIPPERRGERRRRRRRADDPRPSRCAGARAVQRDAQRGRRVPRRRRRVGVRVRRAARERARRGRGRGVGHRVRNSARTSWRASGIRTSRPSPAAPDSDWRSRDRRCSRTTARWPPTARSGREPRFDSCCRSTAAAMEGGSECELRRDLIPIVLFVCIAATAIGVPIAQAFARRIGSRPERAPAMPPDVTARLERMEQAIDSIAIEVERISEGQRFTTKLLSERGNGRRNVPRSVRREHACADRDRAAARPDDIPPGAIEIVKAFFTTIAVIALGIPIIRAFTRRWERGPAASDADVARRHGATRAHRAGGRSDRDRSRAHRRGAALLGQADGRAAAARACRRSDVDARSAVDAERSDRRRRAEHSADGRRAARRRGLRGARRARRRDRPGARARGRAGRRCCSTS